jgi:hypothetical protein
VTRPHLNATFHVPTIRPAANSIGAADTQFFCVDTRFFRGWKNPAPEALQKLVQRVSAGTKAPLRPERRRCDTSSAAPYVSVAMRLGVELAINTPVLTERTPFFRGWGLQPPHDSRSKNGALAPEALPESRHIFSASGIRYPSAPHTNFFRGWGLQPPRYSHSHNGALAPEVLTESCHVFSSRIIH